ncbi:hypothetical protein BDQ17DRAFT_530354 [Cyathus striatus]|nr:hypothetical protein BDQ17DRAFT_530354 [Cyathus striatus]
MDRSFGVCGTAFSRHCKYRAQEAQELVPASMLLRKISPFPPIHLQIFFLQAVSVVNTQVVFCCSPACIPLSRLVIDGFMMWRSPADMNTYSVEVQLQGSLVLCKSTRHQVPKCSLHSALQESDRCWGRWLLSRPCNRESHPVEWWL